MPNTRFAPLLAILLSCTALSSTAQAGWFGFGSKDSKSDAKPADTKDKAAPAAATLEESIRQAQMLRMAGNYQEAVKHLSQLMMVASDDPGVVGEYGKTLAAMGRAKDAVSFLTRAQQLQPNDWTIYSALGVAYDQLGNQKEAQPNYERALILKPGEPSVLSNYALSRLLAKDTAMAANLAGRAEIANAAARDDKIGRNIAMVRSMIGEQQSTNVAVNKPAPSPQVAAQTPAFVNLPAPPAPAPRQPVQRQPVQRQVASNNPPPNPAPISIPAPPAPQPPMIQAQPQIAPSFAAAPAGVVMQRVPADPMAGPVNGPVANRAPRALQPRKAEAVARAEPAHAEPAHAAPAPAAHATPAATPVSPATGKPMTPAEALQARAEALAKTLANKPGAIAAAKNEAAKPAPAQPVKAADAKPVAPAPKVLPPAPVKAAEAKPAATTKAAAKPKDAIPGLRLSANAY